MPVFKLPNIDHFWNRLPRFGDQLRNLRTLRGMTVEQLAAAANISATALRDIEAGKRAAPPKETTLALASALHLEKAERGALLEAAEMESPMMNAILGREPAKPGRPTLTAAILVFLFADIRGYTRFTQEFGDEAAAGLTQHFAALAHAAVERWDGQIVETRGDEVLAVFASARQAVRAARDLQDRYEAERSMHPEMPAGIGIGLDLGEAALIENGYRGAAVNRAARLCGLAGPGEVLVSTGVVYVAPQVDGVTFVARGQEQLKGFDGPIPILLATPRVEIDAAPAGEEPAPDGD